MQKSAIVLRKWIESQDPFRLYPSAFNPKDYRIPMETGVSRKIIFCVWASGTTALGTLFHNIHALLATVKEEIFVGEKFRTFSSKTYRMELNFVLSNWPKTGKTRKDDRKACKPCRRNFGWKLISYIFELYESYEIKFPSKISSFTVYFNGDPLDQGSYSLPGYPSNITNK